MFDECKCSNKKVSLESFSEVIHKIALLVVNRCTHTSEAAIIKKQIQDSYAKLVVMFYEKSFFNWGLWDQKIYNEYCNLDFDFSTVSATQDPYSQTLLYYLIRPLVKAGFFNKRLLDVGSGNGIGLKISSEILRSNYAQGVDLVSKMVEHSNRNFYKKNKINYIQSDAEKLPFENESFDIITNLESSHLYPEIGNFFSEVERVLSPGGFFCYADMDIQNKHQMKYLNEFIKKRKNLTIILKQDITKKVQSSIYQRVIVNEEALTNYANFLFGDENFSSDLPLLVCAMGLGYLPWWKLLFKNSAFNQLAKKARRDKSCGKYYYYLIQKNNK